jgi:orotate phosphoribosyltransferase
MSARDELKKLLREKSLVIGEIVLSSGQKSNYYLDCKLTTLDPRGAYLTGEVFLESLQAQGIAADAIGGLSMGADPIVSAVAVVSHMKGKPLPGFLIRKEAKKHGRMKRIEGMTKNVKRVVIIDEVCTTGKATQEAIDAVEEEGYTVVAVASLVDREEGGSAELRAKYKYFSIFTASELLAGEHDRPTDAAGKLSQPARPETALHK